jgi:hypothetical protein
VFHPVWGVTLRGSQSPRHTSMNKRRLRAADLANGSCSSEGAVSSGAKDNISPRAPLDYYPGCYAADVFDPDGYSFEVVHKS